mmetsp:Transcript_64160/g.153228  ORF Transcript_64160/g.153228 Transcript_64160/m.153228 type:complete len:273 (+) Transcript_64160:71-889(+)
MVRGAMEEMRSRKGLPTLLAALAGLCLGSWLERSASFTFPFWSWGSPMGAVSSSWRRTGSHSGQPWVRRGTTGATALRSVPLIGNEAPDFSVKAVVDQEFVDVSLTDYRGKYVILFFYPLDFTFVCPTEIIAFSDRIEEFRERDAEVLGVSVDSEYSHLAWIQMSRDEGGLGDIEYPLLSDLKKDLAVSYGVLAPDGASFRGLFIIDREGVVQHSTINNNAFGRNVDEVIRVLDAIKYVQENPDEVCPAGWQPGDRTMRPDFEGKREYFQDS